MQLHRALSLSLLLLLCGMQMLMLATCKDNLSGVCFFAFVADIDVAREQNQCVSRDGAETHTMRAVGRRDRAAECEKRTVDVDDDKCPDF